MLEAFFYRAPGSKPYGVEVVYHLSDGIRVRRLFTSSAALSAFLNSAGLYNDFRVKPPQPIMPLEAQRQVEALRENEGPVVLQFATGNFLTAAQSVPEVGA